MTIQTLSGHPSGSDTLDDTTIGETTIMTWKARHERNLVAYAAAKNDWQLARTVGERDMTRYTARLNATMQAVELSQVMALRERMAAR